MWISRGRVAPEAQVAACLYFFLHTNHTQPLLAAALRLLQEVYVKGYAFHKAGVLLTNLQPESVKQLTFWDAAGSKDREPAKPLMRAMDRINAKYGKDTLHCSTPALGWRSAEFTTKGSDIPVVRG